MISWFSPKSSDVSAFSYSCSVFGPHFRAVIDVLFFLEKIKMNTPEKRIVCLRLDSTQIVKRTTKKEVLPLERLKKKKTIHLLLKIYNNM
jgi:hypothetical protein